MGFAVTELANLVQLSGYVGKLRQLLFDKSGCNRGPVLWAGR